MHPCPECGFEAKSKGGLAGHRRAKHPAEAKAPSTVSAAVEAQLPKDTPPALRAAALKVAWGMDTSDSTRDLAALSRELRSVLSEIAGVTEEADEDVVDDLAARRAARRAAAAGKSRPASG